MEEVNDVRRVRKPPSNSRRSQSSSPIATPTSSGAKPRAASSRSRRATGASPCRRPQRSLSRRNTASCPARPACRRRHPPRPPDRPTLASRVVARRLDRGGRNHEQALQHVVGSERALLEREAAAMAERLHRVGHLAHHHVTAAPAAASDSILRRAVSPPPTTGHGWPVSRSDRGRTPCRAPLGFEARFAAHVVARSTPMAPPSWHSPRP